jgi:hypothetical protein
MQQGDLNLSAPQAGVGTNPCLTNISQQYTMLFSRNLFSLTKGGCRTEEIKISSIRGCTPKPAEFVHFLKIVSYSQSIPAKTASKSIGLRLSRNA